MRFQHATDSEKYNLLSAKGKSGNVRGTSAPAVTQLLLDTDDNFIITEDDDFIEVDQ